MLCTCDSCVLATLAKIGVSALAVFVAIFAATGIHQVRADGPRAREPRREERAVEQSLSAADIERNSLLAAENEILEAYYRDMPLLPIEWAAPRGEAYAFTDCRAIYFVADRYRFNAWAENVFVLKHEMAHVAAGCGHGHDEVWRRELARLTAGATVRDVGDIEVRD